MIKVEIEETSKLLSELVARKSVNPLFDPASSEKEVGDYIVHELEESGVEVRTQKVTADRFNVIGLLPGEHPDRVLALNGHIDTVNVKDPSSLKPRLDRDGRLHGRGACDMKGGVAAMILAMKKLRQENRRMKSTILFSAVVDEENQSLGTQKVVSEYKPTAAIVTEPTELRLAVAQKGAQRIEIETFGKAAHGGVPELGVDAIAKMAAVIMKLGDLEAIYKAREHPLLGNPKIHCAIIEGGKEWTTVPDYCRLKVEKRSLPGEEASGETDIRKLLEQLASVDPNFSARVRTVLERKPMETSKQERIVTSLRQAASQVLGAPPPVIGVNYWTDAAFFATDHGIPTCIFGPGSISQAHSDAEYVEVNQVVKAARIYALVAELF